MGTQTICHQNFSMLKEIFDNGEGGVSILMPAPNCGLTLQQIHKDIPDGDQVKLLKHPIYQQNL